MWARIHPDSPLAKTTSGPARMPGPGATRDVLDRYLDEIGQICLLEKADEQILAREIEAATEALRQATVEFPAFWHKIVQKWNEIRRAGKSAAKLAEDFAGPAPKGQKHEIRMHRLAHAMQQRLFQRERLLNQGGSRRDIRNADKGLRRAALRADVSRGLVQEFLQELRAHMGPVARGKKNGAAGLPKTQFLEKARICEAAHQRLQDALHTFVRHNLRLVVSTAKRFRRDTVPFDDLIQEGNLGLMRAAEKFEHERNLKFSTYAVWWIRQSLIRAVQNQSRAIRVPSHIHDMIMQQKKAQARLEIKLGREPTTWEIAEAMEMEEGEIQSLKHMQAPVRSLSEPVSRSGEDGGQEIGDTLEDAAAKNEGEDGQQLQIQTGVGKALAGLPEKHRLILMRRFAIHGEPERTLEELGREFGISRERVRQLETEAMEAIRESASGPELARMLGLNGVPKNIPMPRSKPLPGVPDVPGWAMDALHDTAPGAKLSEVEAQVLCWSYGIGLDSHYSPKQIAERLPLAANRVKAIERRAITRVNKSGAKHDFIQLASEEGHPPAPAKKPPRLIP